MFAIVTCTMLRQASFDDMGTPLSGATFCVLDLETTGGSPEDDAITEVAAVKVRCGVVEGTFDTLVNPNRRIPAFIRALTGITDESLADAAPIDAVLPSFLEFSKGTILVAHNARFDIGFLNAALTKRDYAPLTNQVLDTALLARKVLAGEVPNNKLSTLARHLRTAHQPCHRALPDVLATVDLLHHLIERVGAYGITTVDDLASISWTKLDGTFRKITLAKDLPRGVGVYRFLGARGETLYVGKATDVRSRVRSYFFGDPRRRMRNLLKETQDLKIELHDSLLEAEVAEARAIALEKPPYNRRGKRDGNWYLKVTTRPHPKVAAARTPKEDGSIYLGPLGSMKQVRLLIDVLRTAVPIHRCAEPRACDRCAFHEIGRCAGGNAEDHAQAVATVAAAIGGDHRRVLAPLEERMWRLAEQERFEEAEELRAKASTLARCLERASAINSLVEAGEIVLNLGTRRLMVRGGRLIGDLSQPGHVDRPSKEAGPPSFLDAALAREAAVISSWMRRQDGTAHLVSVSGRWTTPVGAKPTHAFDRAKGIRTATASV
jgi:DNA polymerase-3 subunit epsilon